MKVQINLKAIDAIIRTASSTSARQALAGVNFVGDGKTLTIQACNEAILQRLNVELPCEFDFTVPAAELRQLTRWGDTQIEPVGNAVRFINSKKAVLVSTMPYSYPNVDEFIPSSYRAAFSINKSEFVHSLELIDGYVLDRPSTSSKTVRLNFSNRGVTAQLGFVDKGKLTTSDDEFTLKTDSVEISKNFGANFILPTLLQGLKGLSCHTLNAQMLNSKSPLVLTNEYNIRTLALVMPIGL